LQDDGWLHTDLLVDGRDAREAAEVRKVVSIRVFFTARYRAVYRGYRLYRWGTVTVPRRWGGQAGGGREPEAHGFM
jgi:hypothetical protein